MIHLDFDLFYDICNTISEHNEDKKAKGTKMCVIKQKPKFENYENCLKATKF